MANAQPSWFEQLDLLKTLGCIVAFFLVRTLKGLDKNQGLLFKKHDDLKEDHTKLATDFAKLAGKCEGLTASGHCEVKK